ncbi:MAG: hypothetical protein FWC95_08120 [Defluviitaleaceae bacterium]|nr:hypothetical protein [Defluviitaleaceae bacterium]
MTKHKYCCQNAIQDYLDHIIPVPSDFNVNPHCFTGMAKEDFIDGLKALTDVVKDIYLDMIENPADYGLPLVEDIEYKPFNPKAADSRNSAFRLVSLLHCLANSGELTVDGRLIVNKQFLAAISPKSIYKISNVNMLYKKLTDHGFEIDCFNGKTLDKKRDDFTVSYRDNRNLIHALYGYMRNALLQKYALFSLNYFLAEQNLPTDHHQQIFAEYLKDDEDRRFYNKLFEAIVPLGLVAGLSDDYTKNQFRTEFKLAPKNGKILIRCYSGNGKLRVHLRLRRVDMYTDYLIALPERVKKIFRAESTCRTCVDNCSMINNWTFEGITYKLCGYMQYFEVTECRLDDFGYYLEILSRELQEIKNSKKKQG